jgi:hypothetical protein
MRWNFATGRRLETEAAVADKLRRASKFYRFLWEIRAELFDDAFQRELEAAYQPRGQEPCPPALLAMVNLLQRYEGLSDAAAVDAAENDRRWQLVLGTLGSDRAPFGQGSLVRFRVRMVEHDLDKKLLDRTVELAKQTGKFGWQKLRVAIDSSPLRGAGRVEDTWNLIGRAMGKVVAAVAAALDLDSTQVIERAGLTMLQAASIKAALDIDWTDEEAQHEALQLLIGQATTLETWVVAQARSKAIQPPLSRELDVLRRVVGQDIEPDPDGSGVRIIDGVAKDRVVSISDREMRHGRKSKSTRFDGYKRHIAIANGFVVATTVLPANRQEHQALKPLLADIGDHGSLDILDIDRGYLGAPEIKELHGRGVAIRSRAWRSSTRDFFPKEDFHLDLANGVVTCPAQAQAPISPKSGIAYFAQEDCASCPLKIHCTATVARTIRINPIEPLLIELRQAQASPEGRAELRQRIPVEHKLARLGSIQGPKARYMGARKNELDVNRAAAIVNLHEYAALRAIPSRHAA